MGHDSIPPRRTLPFLLVAWPAIACLSPSQPPVGQHLLNGRDFTGVYLSPAEQEKRPSFLLVTAPLDGPVPAGIPLPVSGLYALPRGSEASATSGTPTLVVEGFLAEASGPIGPSIPTDLLGRLWVVQAPRATNLPIPFNVLRVDLEGGTQEVLAQGLAAGGLPYGSQEIEASPARASVCVDAATAVFPLHGEPRAIGSSCDRAVFLGEDLYYVNGRATVPVSPPGCGAQAGLCRLGGDGSSELLLAAQDLRELHALAGARKLLLTFLTTDGLATFAWLDGNTLAIAPLPAATQYARLATISPDGRWVGFVTAPGSTDGMLLLDATTGSYAPVAAGRLGKMLGTALWRPGRDEIWLADPDADRFAVVKLAAQPGTVAVDIGFHPGTLPAAFTADGKHCFRSTGGWGDVVYVGSADDLAAPLWPINQAGTYSVVPQSLADGRLLVESRAIDDAHLPKDLAIVDADTGQRRSLCSGCKWVALGQTRALLLVDWALADNTGNLILVDLQTLARTRLAESVYAVAVDRAGAAEVPPGGDALAVGTQVAFLVRNRLDAPYDGLWLARLP